MAPKSRLDADNSVNIAAINEQITSLLKELADIKADIKNLNTDVKSLNDLAARSKGAFFVIVGLGAFIGWLTTLYDKFWKFIHG